MGSLVLEALSKRYGASSAVERVDLDVSQGEMVALLGPSGCGKTTTLRMVAGFVPPTAGRVLIGGKDVTRSPPHARDTGMVFQSYALFPHMDVAANVAFGLEMRRVGRAERDARVREALRLVRLDSLEDRLPRQLPGGQQQRVALARALVVNPSVFLLDEPLSNLDAKLRAEVRMEIRTLQRRLGLTTLVVTHDQEEALTMADRLVVMERGRVRQVGTAEDLYERPADPFVAGFVGRCNLIEGAPGGPGTFRTVSGALLPSRLCPYHGVWRSGADPEGWLRGDECESVGDGQDGSERSGGAPGVAPPPEDLDTIAGRKRLQPGHGRPRAGRGQGVAASDAPRLHTAARPGVAAR